jgi:hypothetical protein
MKNQGSNMLSLTDPTKVLKNYYFHLKGVVPAPGNDSEMVVVSTPMMNDEGVYSMMSFIESIVNQVNMLGNIDKNQRRQFGLYAADALAKVLMVNRVTFDIGKGDKAKVNSTRDLIYDEAMNMIHLMLTRPLDNNEKMFWGKTVQELKYIAQSSGQKKEGILSGITNAFKRD